MLKAFASLVFRHRLFFLIFGLFCMAAASLYAYGIFTNLSQTGFMAPNSQSETVDTVVNSDFGGNRDSLVLLFASKSLTYHQPAYATAARQVIRNVANLPYVSGTSSYYSNGSQLFISKDPHLTYALVGLKGDANQQANEVKMISPWLKSTVLKVTIGGEAAADSELTNYVQKDLSTAEKFSFPITAVLLVVIFGSLTAASLPLALGLYGIIGALFISRLVSIVMPMSVYVLDIVCLLSLGLGIDYSLFIVNRYREELGNHSGNEEEALCRTVSTAGKTVILSGLTVMIAVAGLTIFPINYIRSMGVGGAAAVLVAIIGSLLFLPSLLAMLGDDVNFLKVSRLIPLSFKHHYHRLGVWERITKRLLRYPVVTIVLTLGVLIVIGLPLLKVHFITSGYNILPVGAPARTVAQTLDTKFTSGNLSPLYVLVTLKQIHGPNASRAYVNKLTALGDVSGLGGYQENSGFLLLTLLPKSSVYSPTSESLVSRVRSLRVDGIKGEVGGSTADQVDMLSVIEHYGLYALIIVILAMIVLFYLLLGSIIIPLKTIILTTLSLSAAFGVLVWIFQDGHLDSFIGVTPQGGIDASQLVIIFALAFGLSMDYAAFLFSRIRESFSENSDMGVAIIWGILRTGRIITSAAVLMLAVIASFATGSIVSMKEVAIGLIVAVLVDVFIVRLLLVPASMKLLGEYNWWLPKPLKLLYDKIKIHEA